MRARLVAIGFAALLLGGCATTTDVLNPRPVAREPGRPLERVAVSTVQWYPMSSFANLSIQLRAGEKSAPGVADAVAHGAAAGALAGVVAGTAVSILVCTSPILVAACPSIAGVTLYGATVGAGTVGAASALHGGAVPQPLPREGFEKARDAAESAFRDANLHAVLRAVVLAHARGLGHDRFADSPVPGRKTYREPADYRVLARDGFDGALELDAYDTAISKPDLFGKMSLDIRARARLYSTADGRLLYQEEVRHSSQSWNAVEWTEHEAARLRGALAVGYDVVARQIVANAFAPERQRAAR